MISTGDFIGKWQIAQNNWSNLSAYITRYEDSILVELMGKDLADEFLADPDAPEWVNLKAIGFGLTSLLTGLIYFEFVRDLPYKVTNQGVLYQIDENGSAVIPALMLRSRYNECIRDWIEMQKYLKENYGNFDGKKRKWLTD